MLNMRFMNLKNMQQTINGKLYNIVEFTQKAEKTGNTCPCYECDLEQGSNECLEAKCMEYGKFNYLKQVK